MWRFLYFSFRIHTFCYLFLDDTHSSETSLSFWEDSVTPGHESCNKHFTKSSGLSRCRLNWWQDGVTAVALGDVRAVHVRRPSTVSANVRGRLEKLRHLASARLTCMFTAWQMVNVILFDTPFCYPFWGCCGGKAYLKLIALVISYYGNPKIGCDTVFSLDHFNINKRQLRCP